MPDDGARVRRVFAVWRRNKNGAFSHSVFPFSSTGVNAVLGFARTLRLPWLLAAAIFFIRQ